MATHHSVSTCFASSPCKCEQRSVFSARKNCARRYDLIVFESKDFRVKNADVFYALSSANKLFRAHGWKRSLNFRRKRTRYSEWHPRPRSSRPLDEARSDQSSGSGRLGLPRDGKRVFNAIRRPRNRGTRFSGCCNSCRNRSVTRR